MIVYAYNGGWKFGYLVGRFPGKIGWMLTPDSMQEPDPLIPYAFDNGAYSSHLNSTEWDESKWRKALDRVMNYRHRPEWLAVPDVVGDRAKTLEKWEFHYPLLQQTGRPLLMCVQDGMTPADVPSEAGGVFVGGSVKWKWRTLPIWTNAFSLCHVGKVSSGKHLWTCDRHAVTSVDSSGWFRERWVSMAPLIDYMERKQAGSPPKGLLF